MQLKDLKVTRKTTVETKNALGQRVREYRDIEIKRKVKTTDPGLRVVHLIIDSLVTNGLLVFLFTSVLSTRQFMQYANWINLASLIVFILYYFLMEHFFGQTLGKMVMGNRVINEYCEKPTASESIIRTVCRLIPFEGFSCFGHRGWHDKFANTYVVSNKEYLSLRRDLGKTLSEDDEQTVIDGEV